MMCWLYVAVATATAAVASMPADRCHSLRFSEAYNCRVEHDASLFGADVAPKSCYRDAMNVGPFPIFRPLDPNGTRSSCMHAQI